MLYFSSMSASLVRCLGSEDQMLTLHINLLSLLSEFWSQDLNLTLPTSQTPFRADGKMRADKSVVSAPVHHSSHQIISIGVKLLKHIEPGTQPVPGVSLETGALEYLWRVRERGLGVMKRVEWLEMLM